MLAIVIGYTEEGSQAPFQVLYAGRDASAADGLSLSPPPGFVRTQLFKNPAVVRTRSYPENILPADPAPELIPAEEKPRKAATAK